MSKPDIESVNGKAIKRPLKVDDYGIVYDSGGVDFLDLWDACMPREHWPEIVQAVNAYPLLQEMAEALRLALAELPQFDAPDCAFQRSKAVLAKYDAAPSESEPPSGGASNPDSRRG